MYCLEQHYFEPPPLAISPDSLAARCSSHSRCRRGLGWRIFRLAAAREDFTAGVYGTVVDVSREGAVRPRFTGPVRGIDEHAVVRVDPASKDRARELSMGPRRH